MKAEDFKNRHEKVFRRYENEEYYIKYKDGQPTIQKRLKIGSRVLTVVYYYKEYDNKIQIMFAASHFKKTSPKDSFCKRDHLATARSRIKKFPNFIEYNVSKPKRKDKHKLIKTHINTLLRHMLNQPFNKKDMDQLNTFSLSYDLMNNSIKDYYTRLSHRKGRENFIRSAIFTKGVQNKKTSCKVTPNFYFGVGC